MSKSGNGPTIDDLKERPGLGTRDPDTGSRVASAPRITVLVRPDGGADTQGAGDFKARIARLPPETVERAKMVAEALGEDLGRILLVAVASPDDFEKIASKLEVSEKKSGSGLDLNDIPAIATKLLGAYVDKVKPLIDTAKELEPQVAQELAVAIGIVADLALDTSKKLRAQRERGHEEAAWARWHMLKAYMAEGFTREEAMALVLAAVKQPDFSSIQRLIEGSTPKITARKG